MGKINASDKIMFEKQIREKMWKYKKFYRKREGSAVYEALTQFIISDAYR